MTGELKQEDLEQVQKLCKEAGIVPAINPANEDLRMKELKRLGMLEKDLEKDRYGFSKEERASVPWDMP